MSTCIGKINIEGKLPNGHLELQHQLLICQNLLMDMDGRNMKATWYLCDLKVVVYLKFCQPRWLSGLRRSLVHSLMIASHCVLRNWDQIPVRAVRGLIFWLAWSRYVRYCDNETLNSSKPNAYLE